jgi:CRISPR-associated protein Cas1
VATLYIDRKGAELRWRDGALEVKLPDEGLRTVPAALLGQVVMRAETVLSSTCLAAMTDSGIGVLAFGGRAGQKVAHLLGAGSRDCRARIAQCQRLADGEWVEEWCRLIVRQRLRGQARVLALAMAERPDLRKPLFDGQQSLQRAMGRVETTQGRDAIRGLEGAGAAAYFRAYQHLFPSSVNFTARRRRPPPDPVNACLSLGYALLSGRAVHACWVAGLDPMVGYLHLPAYSRPSLACDLIEPQRSRIEQWVWHMWRERILRLEHFGADGAGACLLGKAGRERFYAEIHPVLRRCERALVRSARKVAVALSSSAEGLDGDATWESEEFEA